MDRLQRGFLCCLAAASFVFFPLSVCASGYDGMKVQSEINRQLSKVKNELESKIKEASNLEEQKQAAYDEWKSITVKQASLEIKQYRQKSDLLQTQEQLVSAVEDEKELKLKVNRRYQIFSKRLLVIQEERGNHKILSVLVNSRSISDFLSRSLALSYIMKADQAMIDSLNEDLTQYKHAKATARDQLENLQALQNELEQTEADLNAQHTANKGFLAYVSTQYGWTLKEIQSLRAEYVELERKADTLQVQAGNEIDSSGNRGFDVRGFPKVAAAALDEVLSGRLTGYGSVFFEVGKEYGIEPAFLMAVAMSETGGDSRWLREYNNVGGFIHNGPMSFSTVEESIRYMGSLLSRLYIQDGLYTVESIHARYSPEGAGNDPAGLNAHWVKNVYTYLGKAGVH
ncbi:coiled-coil domain-containing protein [Bacillus sp. 1P06AnD]|uniref:coiled-coil domain-containing protein n=1 Tax=Bacillus sp. 1P06AnD TaxID=3132208 RepID=UPI0039A1B015